MVEGRGETDRTGERMRGGVEDGEGSKCEINPVKVVLMFLTILIAVVHVCLCVYVCVRQCSSAIGSLGYGENS